MQMPLAKLRATILFFCENTDPHFLGKVKLMKLFYFLDFNHVKEFGMPVTWDKYINMEHGPVPTTIKNLVYSVCDEPDEAILSDTIMVEKTEGSALHKIVPTRKLQQSDLDLFSASELQILKEVSKLFYGSNKSSIENAAHEQAPWLETKTLQDIPYTLAAHDPDSKFTEEDIKFYNNL